MRSVLPCQGGCGCIVSWGSLNFALLCGGIAITCLAGCSYLVPQPIACSQLIPTQCLWATKPGMMKCGRSQRWTEMDIATDKLQHSHNDVMTIGTDVMDSEPLHHGFHRPTSGCPLIIKRQFFWKKTNRSAEKLSV